MKSFLIISAFLFLTLKICAQDMNRLLITANEKASAGDYNGAMNDFNQMLAEYPGYASKILFFRGNLHTVMGKYAEAIADFDKVIEKDSTHLEALMYRGLCKMQLKDYLGALADFNSVIAKDPQFGMAYLDRSEAEKFLQLDASACEDIKKAIALGVKCPADLQEKLCGK